MNLGTGALHQGLRREGLSELDEETGYIDGEHTFLKLMRIGCCSMINSLWTPGQGHGIWGSDTHGGGNSVGGAKSSSRAVVPVKLKATAPSYHLIKADISTEITPLIAEKQCEELIQWILEEFEDSPEKIWQTNIFGKSLHDLVKEGIQSKLYRMPENAQLKLQETLGRIVNDGGGGLICIII